MENKDLTNFIKEKTEKLNKRERKIRHLNDLIVATEKRIDKFKDFKMGITFSCVCGCKGKMEKTSHNSQFKKLSGSGNCKDKHYGNKSKLITALSTITKEELNEMKTRVPLFQAVIVDLIEENKAKIINFKNKKTRRFR